MKSVGELKEWGHLSVCLFFFFSLTLVPRNNLFAGKKQPMNSVQAFRQNNVISFLFVSHFSVWKRTRNDHVWEESWKQFKYYGMRHRVRNHSHQWYLNKDERSSQPLRCPEVWDLLNFSLKKVSGVGEAPGVSHSYFGAQGFFRSGHLKDTPLEKHFLNLGYGFCIEVQVENILSTWAEWHPFLEWPQV